MHRFWIMIFLSFDFLDTSRKGKYDYFVAKSGKSLFFAWKVGKMCGRKCVVCDQVKNVRVHTLRTHVLKVFLHAHAHVRQHIAPVYVRTHLRNPCLANQNRSNQNRSNQWAKMNRFCFCHVLKFPFFECALFLFDPSWPICNESLSFFCPNAFVWIVFQN